MKPVTFFLVAAPVFLAAQERPLASLPYTPSLEPGFMDRPVNPCVDPIPADQPRCEVYRRIAVWAESPDLPARRFGQPDDIAEAISLLMQNPHMTGHNLVIDGGLTAT